MLRISREMSRKLGKSPSTPAQLAGQQTQAMTAGARLPTEYYCWYSVGSRAPADSLSPPSDTICGLKYFLKIPPHLAQRRTNSSVKRHLRSALQRWHCRLPHVLVSRARQLHRQKTSRFLPPLADTVWGFNQAFRKTPRTYFHPENTQFASELAICAAQSLLLVLQLLLGAHCLCSLVFSHLQIRLRNNEPIETNSDKHARHCAQHTFNFLT